MITVDASTGFTNFQSHLGWSPHVIPPLIPNSLLQDLCSTAVQVKDMINQINTDINEAQDNLLTVKASQPHHANLH